MQITFSSSEAPPFAQDQSLRVTTGIKNALKALGLFGSQITLSLAQFKPFTKELDALTYCEVRIDDTISAYSTNTYQVPCGTCAGIKINGNGKTPLELEVYNAQGHLLTQGANSLQESLAHLFTPAGVYTVKVVNRGDAPNHFSLAVS